MKEPIRGTITLMSHGIEMKKLENASLDFWAEVSSVLIDGLVYSYDAKLSHHKSIVFNHDPEERILSFKEIDELDKYIF